MRKPLRIYKTWLVALAITAIALGTLISVLVFATGDSRLTIAPYADVIRFEAEGVATLQVRIFDLSGKEVWDSGVVSGRIVDWDRTNEWGERMAYGAYLYNAQGWSADGILVFQKRGKLALLPGDKVQLQAAPPEKSTVEPSPPAPAVSEEPRYAPMTYSHTGDFTISGKLGVGTDNPQLEVHVVGKGAFGDAVTVAKATRALNQISSNATMRVYRINTAVWAPAVELIHEDSISGQIDAYWDMYAQPIPGGSKFVIRDRTGEHDRLMIDPLGKVGIGTTSPSATLEVHGSATNLLALYDPIAPADAKFRVAKDGNVYADGAYYGAGGVYPGGADVAERINTSEWVEPGDVVEIDPEHPGFFRKSFSPYSTKVAGIISTSPGVILGNSFDEATDDWEDNRPVLAIAGRVPLQVTAENGPIQIGDLLVSSSIPGYAMRCDDSQKAVGSVVGKAMEPLEDATGVIVVQVMLR